MYAAILFDLDNTLVDRDAALREAMIEDLGDASIVNELMQLDGSGYGDRASMLALWSQHAGDARTREITGWAIGSTLKRDAELLARLKQLGEKTEIGIITNGTLHNQRIKWEVSGLQEVVPESRFWVSEVVGVEKPEPEIFRVACKALGVDPGDALYIGDHPVNDVQGAERAGMQARLVHEVIKPDDIEKLWKLYP